MSRIIEISAQAFLYTLKNSKKYKRLPLVEGHESVRTGLCAQMRLTIRDTPGAFFWLSRDICIENVNLRYLHGFGVLVTSRKPIVIENNAFCKLSMAPIYISCDANNWYESGRVEDVLIRNNKFYNCQGDGVIFIDPVIEKASEERTVHKNIRIEENEIHYSEKNQELYALKDCRNVQIKENKENLTLR